MKILILILAFFAISFTSIGQSYIGRTIKQGSLKAEPSPHSNIIIILEPEMQIFIISLKLRNNYYNIIDIKTNTEGYIHKSYIEVGEKIKENNEGIFTPSNKTTSINPQIEVYNKTDRNLTLKLNDEIFSFQSYEKKKITVSAGEYNYRASAPGVMPYIGKEKLTSNTGYTWQFYIVTK